MIIDKLMRYHYVISPEGISLTSVNKRGSFGLFTDLMYQSTSFQLCRDGIDSYVLNSNVCLGGGSFMRLKPFRLNAISSKGHLV